MKNCAIVCEYNPFHSGHKYQLDRVRSRGIDNIFCVMSGAFVQSATPAFCDKALRAECAVLGGADAVIELPTVYATASAQIFAEGAVKIISAIKDVAYIGMGAVASPDDVLRIAEIKIKHEQKFSSTLMKYLKLGKSYNIASTAAIADIYAELYPDKPPINDMLSDPNNILCLEYISAINKFAANIEPIIIERRGARHNDCHELGEHVSATAIRNAEENGKFDIMKKYLPYKFDEITKWRKNHAPDMQCYKNIAVYSLKKADIDFIRELRNCSEGLEYLLKSNAHKYDFDSYIELITGKRYGKKRAFRLLLDIILDIDKSLVNKPFVTRLLACKRNFDFTLLPDFVKTTNADIKNALKETRDVRDVLSVDVNATALYNTLCRIDGDYYNYSLIKV